MKSLLTLIILFHFAIPPTASTNIEWKSRNNQKYIMISGPAQASTLMADIIINTTSFYVPKCVLNKCGGAQETLNGMCSCYPGLHTHLHQCIGNERYPQNVWKSACSKDDWRNITSYITSSQFQFAKDNFGGLKADLYLKENINVFVAFRTPFDTFPTTFDYFNRSAVKGIVHAYS